MPICGCFHSYQLARTGLGAYEVTLEIDGRANLKDLLEKAEVASSISVNQGLIDVRFTLSGVADDAKLHSFLELLRSAIIIDLSPDLDECYALGPYKLFDTERRSESSTVGSLINRAKYHSDRSTLEPLRSMLEDFIAGHPRMRNVDCIVPAPKSDPTTPDIAGQCARGIADRRDYVLARAIKVRQTAPQKDLGEAETEEQAAARVANSVAVEGIPPGARALIIDDTMRSGGTMMEIARVLRHAEARQVLGLSVAKDATFARGRIDFSKERWQ